MNEVRVLYVEGGMYIIVEDRIYFTLFKTCKTYML